MIPKVSIITVCFDSAKTIRDTIESVLAQKYSSIEYIVVDGASSDKTMEIVFEYDDRISVVVSEPDVGIYDAMNKGVQLATGDVVGILNSDDVFESCEVVSRVIDRFQQNPQIDIVFGDVVIVEQADLNQVRRYYSSRKFRPWKLRFGWMPPHPATFVRRSVYDKYGLYTLDFKISADYELFVRWLVVHKLSYSRLNRVLVRMRHGGVSTSSFKNNLLLNKEIVKACNQNGLHTCILLLFFKVPFKLLELMCRPNGRVND